MKAIIKAITVLLFISFAQKLQAQHDVEELDLFLQKCLAHTEGTTTSGCTGCIQVTREKWEEAIDLYCEQAQASLRGASQKQLLKTMHANWLRYKENRFKLLDEMYAGKSADLQKSLEEEKLKFVKAYAMEMKNIIHARLCQVEAAQKLED